jgi:hypothetical protein
VARHVGIALIGRPGEVPGGDVCVGMAPAGGPPP